MRVADVRVMALGVVMTFAVFSAPAAAQPVPTGGVILSPHQPGLPYVPPPLSFATQQYISGHDQAQLGAMYQAQQQAAFLQQQQYSQQVARRSMANAAIQRQQIVNGFQGIKNGQTMSQAFGGLQQSGYGPAPFGYGIGFVGGYGYDDGGFGGYPQFPMQAGPQGGGMPFAGQPMGGAQPQGNANPQAKAPALPFEQAQAMKDRAFDTPQHRAAAAKQMAAKKRKGTTRKPAPAKKEPAEEKPVPAAPED